MNSKQLKATMGLAGIYGLRMLGLFLILPVFAIYATDLPGGHNTTLIGLALGAYGLAQAALQLPLGILSDRWGRKPVIYLGLTMFVIGSFICALADSLYFIIFGRVIQGAGAISAAVMALLADLTPEDQRTHAFAIIGSTIGAAFALSLVAGPLLYPLIGVPGMFWLTGVLGLAALLLVWRGIPDPEISCFHADTGVTQARLKDVLQNPELLRLNFGIFSLHAAQMAMFVVLPAALSVAAAMSVGEHWKVYLPVMLASFMLMVPAIIIGEKRGQLKAIFVGAVALLLVAQVLISFLIGSFHGIILYLLLFYTAFNILEASLPSLISKIAPVAFKGTAIGVYNTSQSLGLFVGGIAGGLLSRYLGPAAVFAFSALIVAAWLLLAATMKVPPRARTRLLQVGALSEQKAKQILPAILAIAGVLEAAIMTCEGVLYLKVARTGFDEGSLLDLLRVHGLLPSGKMMAYSSNPADESKL